jgi:hypothetical protein
MRELGIGCIVSQGISSSKEHRRQCSFFGKFTVSWLGSCRFVFKMRFFIVHDATNSDDRG